MSLSNDSKVEVLLIHQQIFQTALNNQYILKVSFVVLITLFFMYLNGVMVYTLWSKPVFKETPRYILFNHMLLNDLFQLFVTSLLYSFGLAYIKLVMAACAFLVIVSGTTLRNAPLNLAVMCLERYVAICFPLRHTEIATQKRTFFVIGIIWFMALIQYIIDFFYSIVTDPAFLNLETFCTREKLFIKQWQISLHQVIIIFFFVSVALISFFTYISIFITTRSVSSSKESAVKARKTVLLHIFQLGLCLTSFLFYSIIERAAAMTTNRSLFLDLQYVTYLLVVILPRCLSPLIYGLRDSAVRPLFIYYLNCVTIKQRSTVTAQ